MYLGGEVHSLIGFFGVDGLLLRGGEVFFLLFFACWLPVYILYTFYLFVLFLCIKIFFLDNCSNFGISSPSGVKLLETLYTGSYVT